MSQIPATVSAANLPTTPLKKHPVVIRIVNPVPGGSVTTSLRSAREQEARGWAVFVSDTEIRLMDNREATVRHATVAAMERDRQYWRDVARQRGGEDVAFEWRATVGANGVTGMEGRPVAR